MIALTLAEVAEATGGAVHAPAGLDPGSLVVDGPVVTDSREAGPHGLYVARVGEHADGHDFVADAVERGAVAALVYNGLDLNDDKSVNATRAEQQELRPAASTAPR